MGPGGFNLQRNKTMKNKLVLIRTYSAGVHIGTLVSRKGKEATLKNAVRLWRWRGANSLHEVAQKGVAQEWTRISERVPMIVLTEAIEIVPVAKEAAKTLEPRWAL